MHLPQELLDEIMGYLSPYGTRSLRDCSLVAKSWVHPSRRRLFEKIDVQRLIYFRLWVKNISPTNLELLQHVRSLSCGIYDAGDPTHDPTDPVNFLRDYSPSLRRLRRLNLFFGRLVSFTQIGTPSAFQHSLSHLSLWRSDVKISALVTLVNYFPNLARLDLTDLSCEADDQPTPPLSRPLRKLSIAEFYTRNSLGLLDQLLGLRPQCEEVTINVMFVPSPSLAQRVIDGVEESIKYLRIKRGLEDIGNPLTLSNCRELRELEISTLSRKIMELDLVSSITSTNIRKITFTKSFALQDYPVGDTYWKKLDSSLCQLVDQSGCEHRLEMVFRAYNVQCWMVEFEEYLPKFHGKGRVTVVNQDSNMVVYCSDYAKQS